MTAVIGLLGQFGVELAVGGTVGAVGGWFLSPPRRTVSRLVLKAAIAGLQHLEAPDRNMTKAELETMARNAVFD